MKDILLAVIGIMVALHPYALASEEFLGSIQGDVLESFGGRPIPGIFIRLQNTKFTALSNASGKYNISNVPAGNYNLEFSGEGYNSTVKTDVMVRPRRITTVNVKLEEQLLEIKENVEVTGSYFHNDEKNPVSVMNLSAEEVRRAPGTAGGISRMLKVMPGTSAAVDTNTDLAVRGGSPYENGYIIDNIEVPNIDHLPHLASSGGAFSALNAALIQSVDFYTGAFSANYTGFLSSITDINLREGNRTEFDGQINLNMSGAALI